MMYVLLSMADTLLDRKKKIIRDQSESIINTLYVGLISIGFDSSNSKRKCSISHS